MSDQQQALAAAAVLRGSPTIKEINFPLTGDSNADFVAGIQALCVALDMTFEMAALALEYMAKVKRSQHEKSRRLEDSFKMPGAAMSNPPPIPIPDAWRPPNIPWTTGGTVPSMNEYTILREKP